MMLVVGWFHSMQFFSDWCWTDSEVWELERVPPGADWPMSKPFLVIWLSLRPYTWVMMSILLVASWGDSVVSLGDHRVIKIGYGVTIWHMQGQSLTILVWSQYLRPNPQNTNNMIEYQMQEIFCLSLPPKPSSVPALLVGGGSLTVRALLRFNSLNCVR